MNNQIKITATLLKIVEEGSSVRMLKHLRLSYTEIADLIEQNIINGNLIEKDSEIVLTENGASFLNQNRHVVKEIDKSKWIEPDYKNKIKKIARDDVFLPSKKELSFLKKLP